MQILISVWIHRHQRLHPNHFMVWVACHLEIYVHPKSVVTAGDTAWVLGVDGTPDVSHGD